MFKLNSLKLLLAACCLSFGLFAQAGDTSQIDINTATAEQFASLNGIGKSKAEAIVAYRSEIGEFKSIDEITMVKGIGTATLEKNKDRLTLSEKPAAK